jgi:hypothetical protein
MHTGSCALPTQASNRADDFCALWHLINLLPEGAADWEPNLAYQ